MKKIIIIHGRASHPEDCWFPWLRRELDKRGFTVIVPSMPETNKPKINVWVPFLEAHLLVDENTYLIGHSLGCQTILRYLEKNGEKIGGAILVGGWLTTDLDERPAENRELVRPWLETPLNWEEIKKKTNNFVAVLSDNNDNIPLEANADLYKEKLGAKVIIELGMGHFSKFENVTELPVVLEELLGMK